MFNSSSMAAAQHAYDNMTPDDDDSGEYDEDGDRYDEEQSALLSNRVHVARKDHLSRGGRIIVRVGDTYRVKTWRCWCNYRLEYNEYVWGGPRWISTKKTIIKRGPNWPEAV